MDTDYDHDIALLTNAPAQAETLLHSLEWAAAGIGLHVNAHKTEYMCFNQTGNISTLNLGSSVSSNETDMGIAKTGTAINRLSVIWKSDLTNKIKCNFFQAAVVLILLYGCTTRTLTKLMEKKLDGNYTRMLQAILDKLSKFLRWSLMIFIIKGFRTIVFIFIVISTTFWPICLPAFFRCLSSLGTYTELRTMSFIESVTLCDQLDT